MGKLIKLTLFAVLASVASASAMAKPPASQTPVFKNPDTLRPDRVTPPRLGPCQVDLSIERITILRLGPGRGWNVAVSYRNNGSEGYDAPANFAGLIVEETIAAYVHGWQVGNIAPLAPGASVTLNQTIAASSAILRPIRAYLDFGPDGPRCGIDTNSANDQLSIAGNHVSEWSASARPILDVRR